MSRSHLDRPMHQSDFGPRLRCILMLGMITALLGGCATSMCRQWAQNAPTIRAETPAAHEVQLGAYEDR